MKKLNIIKHVTSIIFTSVIVFAIQAEASCWTAGAIDGSCQTKAVINSTPTTYSGSCWSAGALNNMCYAKPALAVVAEKKPGSTGCWTAGVLNGMCF